MQHEQQARCARSDRAGARLAVEHGLLAKKGTPKPGAREALHVERRHGFILAYRIRRAEVVHRVHDADAEALDGLLKLVVDLDIERWLGLHPLIGVVDGDGA